jgi:hemerythrin
MIMYFRDFEPRFFPCRTASGKERNMSLLKWNQKYAVGVKALDNHRNTFIGILNELHAAMMMGQAQSVAGPLLLKLKDHARDHHSTEERMLETAKYPGLAQQREQHREFAGKIDEFASRHEQNDPTMYVQLLRFMRDWLHNHMLNEDQQYRPCLNERGDC